MIPSRLFHLSLAFVLLGVATAAAQTETTPKTRMGDRAFLFTLNGLADLRAGEFGGGVGGLYYIANGLAVRLGLGFGLQSATATPLSNDTTGIEQDSSTVTFSIMPAVRYNIGSSGPVVGYVGAQILIRNSTTSVTNASFLEGVSTSEQSTTFGAGAIGGAEWFPFSNVSLAAEYQLMFTTTSGSSSRTIDGRKTEAEIPPRRILSLGAGSGANFLLSFYF
jgi:opacity protein-like surface antigen